MCIRQILDVYSGKVNWRLYTNSKLKVGGANDERYVLMIIGKWHYSDH